MSEINTNKEIQEDEISLLDLFAVLIRYRKLIVFGTLIVTFLAGLYLFVLPLFRQTDRMADVTYAVDVMNIPNSVSAKLPNKDRITPLYLSTYNAQRLPFLVDHIKKNNAFSDDQLSDYEFNSFVQTIQKEGKYKISSSPLGNGFDINLKISIEKIPEATKLVRSIVEDTEAAVQDYYLPLIETLEQNTLNSIEKATAVATSASDMSALQNLQDLSVEIEEFKQSFNNFLTLREDPFVIPEARGRAKKFVIIFVAAFFIFVFAAFCKNAIANIKADPDSKKLISDAWKAGK